MAFDFPTSPSVGQVFGAYKWDGEKWTLAAGDTAGRPFFGAQSTVGTTLAANGFTKCDFNVEVVDSDNCYNPSTSRFTATVAGTYYVWLVVALAGPPVAAALFAADIYKNGVRYQQGLKYVAVIDSAASLQIYATVPLAVGDYIEPFAYNGQPSNTRTIDANTFSNTFGAFRIGA